MADASAIGIIRKSDHVPLFVEYARIQIAETNHCLHYYKNYDTLSINH